MIVKQVGHDLGNNAQFQVTNQLHNTGSESPSRPALSLLFKLRQKIARNVHIHFNPQF